MLPDERYATNLNLLRQAVPAMAAQLEQIPLINVMLLPGNEGELLGHVWDVPTQQWVSLCNSHHPQEDATKEVEAFWSEEQRVFSLLGFGLGHFACAFARKLLPWQRLAIFELSPSLFKAALFTTDFTPLIAEGKRVDLFVGDALDQSMENFWLNLGVDEKMRIASPMRGGHTSIHMKDEYERLSALTVDYLRHHAVGLATWQQFGCEIGYNDVANTPEYVSTPGMNELKDLWKGKPAVCIAAGPSLHKNLPQLLDASIRPHIALITVGTTYALLQGLGLHPDIVTTIDFQPLNFTDQFQHVPLDPSCPLVYLHSTYPETIRRWPGPLFVASNASDYTGWLRNHCEPKYEASLVQTVAHLNLLAAIELGCSPILLLGQDLSMPMEAHHAAGARAQDTAPHQDQDAFIETTDYQGQQAYTRHSFLTMQQTFERIRRMYPDVEIVNCTEGGVALAGIPNKPLAEMLMSIREQHTAQPPQSLRAAISDVSRSYKPQTKWDMLMTEMGQILGSLDACAAWVKDILTLWDAYEANPTPEGLQAIHAHQSFIGQHQAVYSLMAVRRFDFMAMLGTPPPASMAQDQDGLDRFNAERTVHTARMMQDELPIVGQMLYRMVRRLEDVVAYHVHADPCAEGREALTLLARQSWRILRHRLALGWPADVDAKQALRIMLQLAWQQQCYDEVLSLTAVIPHEQKRRLAAERRQAYMLSVAAAAPAYWQRSLSVPAPPHDPGDWI